MSYWHNKVALVTGASSGLGLAVSRRLFAAGASVVMVARDTGRLNAAADRVRLSGKKNATQAESNNAAGQSLAIAADITRQDEVDSLMRQTLDRFGRLDALVNCAGKSARGEILATTPEQFQELWELNFLALVRCTRAAVPSLLQTRGHVVNIGSLASKSGARFLGAYPASKFPVAAYSQQLRLELGPQGLHVLLVCPGPIRREEAGPRYESAATKDLPAAAHLPGGGVKLKGIDPGRLAERILACCEGRKAELVMPAKARLLFALAQLSPSLGDWVLKKMTGE